MSAADAPPKTARKPRRRRAKSPDTPKPEPGVTPVIEQAELAHATHGRVRLRVPAARANPALLEQIRAAFEGQPGIDAVEVKAASLSVVIHYDPEERPDLPALFARPEPPAPPPPKPAPRAQAAQYTNGATPPGGADAHVPKTKLDEMTQAVEDEAEFLAEHSHLARTIVDSVKKLDREIKRGTDNTLDLKILAPVGLAAFTFLEIGAAAATPMWVTLVIFSLNHFVELRAHRYDDAPGAN